MTRIVRNALLAALATGIVGLPLSSQAFDPQPEPPKPPTEVLLGACTTTFDVAITKANAKCSIDLDANVCEEGDVALAPLMEQVGLQALAHVAQAVDSGTRFVDNGDGTVTDYLTGLQWEQKTTAVGSGANPSDPHDVDHLYT